MSQTLNQKTVRRSFISAVIVASAALLLVLSADVGAAWVENGTVVKSALYDQDGHQIISDGNGGAIIVWSDYRNESGYLYYDVYAQRVDKRGEILWTSGGVPICDLSYSQYQPQIVDDGVGGFIIAWADGRSGTYGDIYAQRIDIDGNIQWAEDGVAVCTEYHQQYNLKIAPVRGGGAIIAWEDYRNGSDMNIYAQRINNSGTSLWTSGGVAVCTASYWQQNLDIDTNGNKGAVIVWDDERNSVDKEVYIQEIDSLGSVKYGANGYAVATTTGDQYAPQIVYIGTQLGHYIIWSDSRSGNADIYGTRYYGGYSYWGTNGTAICSVSSNQTDPVLRIQGGYRMIVGWWDQRNSNYDIYAQVYDIFGTAFWTADGKEIKTGYRDQYLGDIVEDATGNFIFSWMDDTDIYHDIFIQKIDEDGNPLWDPDGVLLCDAYYYQTYPYMAADGMGGAIVAWIDERDWQTKYKDLYASRIDASGCWGYPSPLLTSVEDVPSDQGGSVTVAWDAGALDVFPYEEITHYSVWRSLTAGETAMLLSAGVEETGFEAISPGFEGKAYRFPETAGAAYGWEWIGNVPAHRLDSYTFTAATLYDSTSAGGAVHYFFAASHTSDPFTYWDSAPDSGYSVDNLAPAAPLGLAGEQSYSPEGLTLTWHPNGEGDLWHYRVYRGTDPEFVPGPGNLVESPFDTMLFDAEWSWDEDYHYKVSAVDVHGNEGGFALLAPSDITGDDPGTLPRATFLAQNYPNPFNPETTIPFGLKAKGEVTLGVFDVAGRLVAELIGGEMPAGFHSARWNGILRDGTRAASGVYFYRLSAEGKTLTRKMILLR